MSIECSGEDEGVVTEHGYDYAGAIAAVALGLESPDLDIQAQSIRTATNLIRWDEESGFDSQPTTVGFKHSTYSPNELRSALGQVLISLPCSTNPDIRSIQATSPRPSSLDQSISGYTSYSEPILSIVVLMTEQLGHFADSIERQHSHFVLSRFWDDESMRTLLINLDNLDIHYSTEHIDEAKGVFHSALEFAMNANEILLQQAQADISAL